MPNCGEMGKKVQTGKQPPSRNEQSGSEKTIGKEVWAGTNEHLLHTEVSDSTIAKAVTAAEMGTSNSRRNTFKIQGVLQQQQPTRGFFSCCFIAASHNKHVTASTCAFEISLATEYMTPKVTINNAMFGIPLNLCEAPTMPIRHMVTLSLIHI